MSSPSGNAAVPSAPPCVAPPAVSDNETSRWLKEELQPHENALRGYLRSKFPSVDADDVVQESYLRLIKAKATGSIASAKAYFFTVARNTAITIFQRRRIYFGTPLEELPDWRVVDARSDVADHVNEQLKFELALNAIERLPKRCRQIFRLAVLDRLSTSEIAARMGIAENTIYAQIAIGTRKCAEFLREKGERK